MVLAILGIDMAKDSYQVSLRHHDDKRANHTFRNRAEDFGKLEDWLVKHRVPQVHACLEATGRYWEELALSLHQAGHVVSVVNPMRIHSYAQSRLARNKTDKLDAQLIADFCATQQPAPWTPPPPEVRELQALERHLETLQNMRVQEHNRLTSAVPSAQVRKMLQEHLAFIDQQITELKEQIRQHIDEHPDLRHQRDLLVTIPGIAETTAAKLLGENIQAFSKERALAAYAGLSPQQRESGTSVHRKARLCKVGNSNLRKALYFPAICAKTHNPLIKAFCARLEQREKHSMVVIGAAMRKLLCLALGVLKSGIPFDPNYAANVQLTS